MPSTSKTQTRLRPYSEHPNQSNSNKLSFKVNKTKIMLPSMVVSFASAKSL